jgi:hypothetical protein
MSLITQITNIPVVQNPKFLYSTNSEHPSREDMLARFNSSLDLRWHEYERQLPIGHLRALERLLARIVL